MELYFTDNSMSKTIKLCIIQGHNLANDKDHWIYDKTDQLTIDMYIRSSKQRTY